jgi:hypothetical protein
MVRRNVLIVSLFLTFMPAISADRQAQLEGQITGPESVTYQTLRVVARSPVSHDSRETWAHYDGSFSISGLTEGIYEVEVISHSGVVVMKQLISVPSAEPIKFELPQNGPLRGPVSMHGLSHRVPREAMKAYRKAADAAKHQND